MLPLHVEGEYFSEEKTSMRLSNSFLTSHHRIAQSCSNPEKAKEVMKRAMRATLKQQHSRYVMDLFQQLNAKGIGTTAVEGLSSKLCNRLPGWRTRMLVGNIMQWKLADARKSLNQARYNNTKTWRECKPILEEFRIKNHFNEIWSMEKQFYSSHLQRTLKKKMAFLTKKYKIREDMPSVIQGIRVEDQDCVTEFSTAPRVYGGVELKAEENELLTLHPKFSTYQKIDSVECEIAVEKSLDKLRWETTKKKREEQGEEPVEERCVFEPGSKTFDFRQMRGTDLPFNKRITRPKAVDEETEIRMQSLKTRLKHVTNEYINSNAERNNLTESEARGLKSLKAEIKDKTLVVFETDKSGRFAVDSAQNYITSGVPHTSSDPSITMEDHKQIERTMNAHAVALVRMTQAGMAQRDTDRINGNMIISDSHPPPLYTTRKDHKSCDNEEIGPPTRPICGATSSANGRLSYLLNTIVSEVWKRDTRTVCMSTEEMKAEIDSANRRIETIKGVVVGSTDVKALYPSLDIPFTVDKVCEVIQESDIQFEGMWYEEIGMYLSVNYSRNELVQMGLDQVCPTRTTNRGRPPTVLMFRHRNEEQNTRWEPPRYQPTANERRKMIIAALRILITATLENHDYIFNGEIKKQSAGGPIGLDLTGSIAQVFMMWWDTEFRNRTSALGLNILLYRRYVDDINIVSEPTEPGVRYVNGALEFTQEQSQNDEEKSSDERTMNLLQQIGNSIHPSIQLEIDFPSKHVENKMPILDLKVWVETTVNGSKIMHEHYVKPMATKAVINARSAMSWRVKRTVLTQEALRIMLNCSRDLPWQITSNHLSKFSARMQFSGYNHKFRVEVIRSALNAYNKLRNQETNGERPLYRPKSWNSQEREKQRKAKKLDWYKKGGKESLMIIPKTPGSRLLRMYQEEVKKSGLPIYITERAGIQLKRHLQRSNPFQPERCSRSDCLICGSGGKGPCRTNGVNYTITCKDCEEDNRDQEHIYIGETSRTAYLRGIEHMQDLYHKREKSVLWKHCRIHHQDESEGRRFRMDVVGVYTNDAMSRQIGEATRIQGASRRCLMNDKTEWNFISIPRMVLEQ